jgi:hypothetical protein
LAKVTSGVSNYVKKTLSILLKSFSIHVEGLETERQLSVATFSSGKGIAQALTDGMEWNVQEEGGFKVGEAADGF